MFLVQLDNLEAATRLNLKNRLKTMHLSLLNPKPHILRKALRESKWNSLEGAVVGPTAILISRKEPAELREAVEYLSTLKRVTILGGKIGDYTFTQQGVKDVVDNVPLLTHLRSQLVALLQTPSMALADTLLKAPNSLLLTLKQNKDRLESLS